MADTTALASRLRDPITWRRMRFRATSLSLQAMVRVEEQKETRLARSVQQHRSRIFFFLPRQMKWAYSDDGAARIPLLPYLATPCKSN